MATAPKELKFRDAVANGRSVKDGKRMGCLGFHDFIVGNSPIVGKPYLRDYFPLARQLGTGGAMDSHKPTSQH